MYKQSEKYNMLLRNGYSFSKEIYPSQRTAVFRSTSNGRYYIATWGSWTEAIDKAFDMWEQGL